MGTEARPARAAWADEALGIGEARREAGEGRAEARRGASEIPNTRTRRSSRHLRCTSRETTPAVQRGSSGGPAGVERRSSGGPAGVERRSSGGRAAVDRVDQRSRFVSSRWVDRFADVRARTRRDASPHAPGRAASSRPGGFGRGARGGRLYREDRRNWARRSPPGRRRRRTARWRGDRRRAAPAATRVTPVPRAMAAQVSRTCRSRATWRPSLPRRRFVASP